MGAAPGPELARPLRHAREDGRARLLRSRLRLFAQEGFARTSTRELAEDAGVNIASIGYCFGDKAGLYRVVCFEPLGSPADDLALIDAPGLYAQAMIEAEARRRAGAGGATV